MNFLNDVIDHLLRGGFWGEHLFLAITLIPLGLWMAHHLFAHPEHVDAGDHDPAQDTQDRKSSPLGKPTSLHHGELINGPTILHEAPSMANGDEAAAGPATPPVKGGDVAERYEQVAREAAIRVEESEVACEQADLAAVLASRVASDARDVALRSEEDQRTAENRLAEAQQAVGQRRDPGALSLLREAEA
ncbi:MAG: hypothetical protein AAGJ31_05645, partial [Verrucomicrobiota bacterium]